MNKIVLIQIFYLMLIPLLTHEKGVESDDDPNSEYIFNDEGSGMISTTYSETSSSKAEGIEVENSFMTTMKSSELSITNSDISTNISSEMDSSVLTTVTVENGTVDENSLTSDCPYDTTQLRKKVTDIMVRYVPTLLKLKPIHRGIDTKLMLENGRIGTDDLKLIEQPVCQKVETEKITYAFMVSFNDMAGSYHWKIYNLLRNNFSESAIITIKQLTAEFKFYENPNKRKVRLEGIKVGTIDDMNVKVNIPEDITTIKWIKQMMRFVISRITTMVVNRSKDSITSDMKSILTEAVLDKSKIRP